MIKHDPGKDCRIFIVEIVEIDCRFMQFNTTFDKTFIRTEGNSEIRGKQFSLQC